MSRFDNMNNTAPVQQELKNNKDFVPRSAFNFSCIKHFQGLIGMLMPIDLIETLPNEDYKLSVNVMAMLRNPLTRRLMSGMRIYVHSYYMKKRDMWKGFKSYVTKGRDGDIDLSVPILESGFKGSDGKDYTTLTPFSPADFMGVPPIAYDNTDPLTSYKVTELNPTTKVGETVDISALPFVMYNRVCRDYYFNKNLIQNNKLWLPDNEDDWILPFNCPRANVLSGDAPLQKFSNDDSARFSADGFAYVPSGSEAGKTVPPILNCAHFRQFKGDYFTTALPFADLIRGTAPVIDLNEQGSIDWSDVLASSSLPSTNWTVGVSDAQTIMGSTYTSSEYRYDSSANKFLTDALNRAVVNSKASLNLNDLRSLITYTRFMEKNALTDGDYNSLIKAQFGVSPKDHTHTAKYIGGTYQDIVFNEVVQTSEGSDTSPLGSKAGQAISASGGFIGKWHSDDYGYIMTIMSIVPDTIYTQGVSKMHTRLTQSDEYFPILNNLAPQPILNKELYVSGNKDVDDGLFGFTERYSEFKSRQNECMGLSRLGKKAPFDSSLIMSRKFNTTPTLSNDFMTMSPKNIDMSIFTIADEPPFDISVGFNVDKVSPLPYITAPADFDM